MNAAVLKLIKMKPWQLRKEGSAGWKLGSYTTKARKMIDDDPSFVYAKQKGSRSTVMVSPSVGASPSGSSPASSNTGQAVRTTVSKAEREACSRSLPKLITDKHQQYESLEKMKMDVAQRNDNELVVGLIDKLHAVERELSALRFEREQHARAEAKSSADQTRCG